MKAIKYILALLAVSILYWGCTKTEEILKPAASTQADFTFEVSNDGYYPCTVTFTNKSLNSNGFSWNFGNGQTSTLENPSVEYTQPGIYNVTLSCAASNNVYYNTLVKTISINVKDPLAGKTHVMYFTTRGNPGDVYLVYLDSPDPQPQAFNATGIGRPYGMAVDTAHAMVYVTDYENGTINRFKADGTGQETILDITVAGQEAVDYPHGILVIGDKIYWGRDGGIWKANLDGTSPEPFLETNGNEPQFPLDMAYDAANQQIYFVNDKYDYTGGIFKVNLDGTGLTKLVADVDGTAIELDLNAGKMYSTIYALDGSAEYPENGLYWMNLDGTNPSKIGEFGVKATWGMSMNAEENFIYWSYKISNSGADGKIIRANLDGSNQTDWITGVSPHAMVVTWIKL